jgi:filamentous hemagglutinin family protein
MNHTRLFATVSALALFVAVPEAPAKPLGGGGSAPPVVTAPAVSPEAGQAALQAQAAMKRATQAIQAMQAAQRAARDAAAAASNIPNGLQTGGLEVKAGAVPGLQLWRGANGPTQKIEAERTKVGIEQTQSKAILTWETFNIGKDTDLTFDQKGNKDWIALNRVMSNDLAPSRILGNLKADGQVYVINRNGIIFGAGSQVNVNTLVASSLALSNEQFLAGINNPQYIPQTGGSNRGIPQFGEYAPPAGGYVPAYVPGAVKVESGALVKTGSDGKLMLFAPKVENAGRLEATTGQIILAAGEQVWLTTDLSLGMGINGARGFDVGVSGPMPWLANHEEMSIPSIRDAVVAQMAARAEAVGYGVVNTGMIHADRGNVTMQSTKVVQSGVITATSALNNFEGSIRLRAWSDGMMGYSSSLEGGPMFHFSVGTLTLSPGSVTEVMPDLTDTGTIELSALLTRYKPGWIDLRGYDIEIGERASVIATAGKITINASANTMSPDNPVSGETTEDGSRIYIDHDAFISAAGLRDILLDMERNFIDAELRINELRDSPLYRESWMRGLKVIADRRMNGTYEYGPMAGVEWVRDSQGNYIPGAWVGTPLADLSGWVGIGITDLQELSTLGGSIIIKSTGSLITRTGSLLDVGGGSVTYKDGWNNTTRLLGADGQVYDIGQARTDMLFVAKAEGYVRYNAHWGITQTWVSPLSKSAPRFEKGYSEGRDAGTVKIFAAEALVLDGSYWGGTIVGARQATGLGLAKNGTLQLGFGNDDARPFSLGRLVISDAPTTLPDSFTKDSALDPTHYDAAAIDSGPGRLTMLDASVLEQSGMGIFDFNTIGSFTLEEGGSLDLAPRTSFSVAFTRTSGAGTFEIGGTIRSAGGTVKLGSPDLRFGNGGAIDVSGEVVNDLVNGPSYLAPAVAGGKIELSGGLSSVAPGTVLDVSGGAWARLDGGKAKFSAGAAGSILLPTIAGTTLASLDLRAFSAASGGSLSFGASGNVRIGGDPYADSSAFHVSGTLFAERGFRSIGIGTNGNVVVAAGSLVTQAVLGVDLDRAGIAGFASGSRITDLGTVRQFPVEQRIGLKPTELVINANGGDLIIEAGTVIRTDIGGAVTLNAPFGSVNSRSGNVTILGTIEAPAGRITIGAAGTTTLKQGSSLTARGAAAIFLDNRGYRSGWVLSGGSVSVDGGVGLIVETGAVIDVSGTAGMIEIATRNQVRNLDIASNGGSIILASGGTDGGTIDGTLLARAGGSNALGGALVIRDESGAALNSSSILPIAIPSSLYWIVPVTGAIGFNTGSNLLVDLDIYDEFGTAPINLTAAMLAALRNQKSVAGLGMEIIDGPAAVAGGEVMLNASQVNPALDPRVIYLLNKYFWTGLRTPQNTRQLVSKLSVLDVQVVSTRISANSFRNGGFSNVDLVAPSGLKLDSGLDVNLGSANLTINTPFIGSSNGGNAALRAGTLKWTGVAGAASASTTALAGKLTLAACLIDLSITTSIRGFAESELAASNIRFFPSVAVGQTQPSAAVLDVEGAVILRAGQIYPSTGTQATINATQRIMVEQNGIAGTAPLSAGGSLTLAAPIIEQNGTLRAPFGQIVLKAGTSLILGEGSLTSVSGDGLVVPYGVMSNGEFWLDPMNYSAAFTPLAGPPEKRVTLDAPDVTTEAGSRIDTSGGGDLYAWEFVPGPGGSHDVLGMPNTYAILPSYAGDVVPAGNGGVGLGDRVWLAGGNGLAAGWYTLLPARYAALPGAYMVSLESSGSVFSMPSSVRLTDGSVRMAGKRGNSLTGIEDQLDSSWRVMNSAQLRQYTEYNEAFANTFFASEDFKLTQYRLTGQNIVTPRLPMDGGAVVLKAAQQLMLGGELKSRAATGGRGGLVDIAGTKLAVVGAGQDAASLRTAGYLVIGSADLSSLGAASLLLGGVRSGDSLGLRVDVTATDIVVRNDEDSALSGPEIILAASGTIDVEAGSVILASGDVAGGAGDLVIAPRVAAVYGDIGESDGNPANDILLVPARDYGSLIRVSNGDAVKVIRSGVDIATGGLVAVGANAVLGGKAVLIDATRNTTLATSASLSASVLSVASGRIGFGSSGTEGLVLSGQSLAQLANTRSLTLRSYTTIDFHTSVNLGGAGLASVTLDAAGFAGYGANDVSVTGGRIVLANSGAAVSSAGSGKLMLTAGELVLGAGTKAIRGFSNVVLTGHDRVVAEGNGSLDAGASDLVVVAPVVTGRGGASQSVVTTGDLALTGGSSSNASSLESSLGTRLAFSGGSVHFDGRIAALGGSVALTASSGDVVLADGALIDVGGFAKTFFDVTEYADAGSIALVSAAGDVRVASDATLNLSAHAGGGDAGSLSLTTAGSGTVILDGDVTAKAGAGGKGGSFALNIADLPDFAGLGRRLNTAGFSAARAFRIREGNVTVDGTTIVGDFALTTDLGSVTILGEIDARSTYGGRIAISAGNGITMMQSAVLKAGATDVKLGSGRVTLEASGGVLDLRGGTIDVAGGEGGKVRLRANQTSGHDEVAVAALATRMLGANTAVLEAVRVYENVATVDATMTAQTEADAAAFMSHAGAIATRLGNGDIALMPGIELRSAGDMTVAADWNLFAGFADTREGGLTLRASGNLIVNGHISDGFDRADRTGVLQDTKSWDLRLIAGGDMTSASALALKPLASLATGSGSLIVGTAAAGKVIRTGAGDLDIRAARNVDLAHHQSVIYTAGRKDTAVLANFAQPVGAVYGINGGTLTIAAQGNIGSTLPTDQTAYQLFTEWLNRAGGANASWWVNYGAFNQGVGALGGGNLSVTAGGDIVNMLVALPTNGRVHGIIAPTDQRTLDVRNGGLLSVTADGSVLSGQYYVARGRGDIYAGALLAGRTVQVKQRGAGTTFGSRTVAPILAVGDAALNVRSRGDLEVQTVIEPTMIGTYRSGINTTEVGAAMSLYTDRTELNLRSIGGDVRLKNDPRFLFGDMNFSLQTGTTPQGYPVYADESRSAQTQGVGNRYPAVTRVTSLNGSITAGPLSTLPGHHAELSLIAERDIRLTGAEYPYNNNILLSGVTLAAIPSPFHPFTGTGNVHYNLNFDLILAGPRANDANRWYEWGGYSSTRFGGPLTPEEINPPRPAMMGDYEPSIIYARSGSILGDSRIGATITSNEQILIHAGTDIRGIGKFNLRNLHSTDVSVIEAGNDIIGSSMEIVGPGGLLLSAGRDVYNVSAVSIGKWMWDGANRPILNTDIRGLPEDGASISVIAGLNGKQPFYQAFEAAYLDPANVGAMPDYLKTTLPDGTVVPVYLTDLRNTDENGKVDIVRRGLVSFIAETTGETLSPLDAWTRFHTLPKLAQESFLRRVYLQELRDAGRDQNEPGEHGLPRNGGYNRGYAAIASLFPGDDWKGDVISQVMTLRTMAGGDVEVLTPGGGLQVAALGAVVPAGAGLVTLDSGHIGIFTKNNVTVNRSRILTFVPNASTRGSDMIIWSTIGDIDAGRGAKTLRVPSAPDILTDTDGNTRVLERSDMSGSGMGTIGDGDLDLVAPEGTVNAGDAGVRVASNLNIAALHVVNADNIQVGGKSKGVPLIEAPDIGGLTEASNAAGAAQQGGPPQTAPNEQPSIIIVEVLGFGGGNGDGSPESEEELRRRTKGQQTYDPNGMFRVLGNGEFTGEQTRDLTEEERNKLGGTQTGRSGVL